MGLNFLLALGDGRDLLWAATDIGIKEHTPRQTQVIGEVAVLILGDIANALDGHQAGQGGDAGGDDDLPVGLIGKIQQRLLQHHLVGCWEVCGSSIA